VLPEAADGLKATVQDNLAWLDPLMAGKPWIVGPRFTMADIILYAALDFGRGVGQSVGGELANVSTWFERVGARTSAAGSLHPMSAALGSAG
jgi:glutathione S-transferase